MRAAAATAPDGFAPDFGLAQLRAGRGEQLFTFTRLELMRLGMVSPELYTTTFNLALDIEYAVTIDLPATRFLELVAIWPVALRHQLAELIMNADDLTDLQLPRDTFFFGVRTHLGAPQTNPNETYVPFIAASLMPASDRFELVIE